MSRENGNDASGSEKRTDLVVPYLLGELSSAEEAIFEQDLVANPVGQQLLEESLETLTALAEKVAAVMPAPRKSLKDRVLKAALASSESVPANGAPHIVPESANSWIAYPGSPGIDLKILYKDPTSDFYTVLARLAPGTHYAPHRHVGTEQCYVISGDLHVNDIDLAAGDFIATDDGTEHQDTYSNGGCLLLLTTQLADQMLG